MRRRTPVAAAWLLLAIATGGCSGVTPTASVPATAAPSPTVSATGTPISTPAPTPTAAPPSPSPAPTAAPTPVSGDVVIARFSSGFLDVQPDFHISCVVDADLYAGKDYQQLQVYLAGDISGEDFSGSMTLQSPGVIVEAEMVVLDDVNYVRPARGEWTIDESFEQTQPLNPFTSDISDNVQYQGTVIRNGRTLHDLYIDTWIGGDLNDLARRVGLRRARMPSSSLDVYVGDDGLPVSAELGFTITGRYDGQPVEFIYYVTYGFSEIGQSIVIEAPI